MRCHRAPALAGSSSAARPVTFPIAPVAASSSRTHAGTRVGRAWSAAAALNGGSCSSRGPRTQCVARVAKQDEALEVEGGEDEEEMGDTDVLNGYFGIPGMIEFNEGEGGLPRCFLKHPYNESAVEIYLHGAAVTQWLRPDGSDGLALRQDADYGGEAAIESGVKLCFPQYREGAMPEDGFANKLSWEVVAAGLDSIPLPDGFRVRLPSDENVAAFVADAAAAEREREEEAKMGAKEKGKAAADKEPAPALPTDAQIAPQAPDGGDVDAMWEGGEWEDEEDEDEDEVVRQMNEMIPPDSAMDPATRLIKRYMDSGLDPAPYVTLRLRDSDATREHWPHAFELLYKITLMEEDDIDDPRPGADVPTFSTETSPRRVMDSLTAKAALEDMVDEEGVATEQEAWRLEAGLKQGPELQPTMVSPDEEHSVGVGESRGPQKDAKDDEVAMQLRLQLCLLNNDAEGSAPMSFQVAQLAHFATKDIIKHGDFVKVRGLGGANVIDYSDDERRPTLSLVQEDYIHFRGQRIDATFVNAADATVAVCPGDAVHFELKPRMGHKDMLVYHPGVMDGASREDADGARTWAAIGTGRVSIPEELAPGNAWHGEFVLRFHDHFWREPVWGADKMQPLGGIPSAMVEQDSDIDGLGLTGEENYGEGGPGDGSDDLRGPEKF